MGCQKCIIKGIYDKTVKRTYFAEFNLSKRTDASFRGREEKKHHKMKSLLECIEKKDGTPLLDMVKDFPTSDPLHLLDQGVMKKLLKMWMSGYTCIYDDNTKKKWSKEIITAINLDILQWNKEFPSDFHRKLRSLQYTKYFKATEFRTILLYIGVVAFRDILPEKEYVHFLLLCIAVKFYSCRYYVQNSNYKDIARQFLLGWCDNFVEIYGKTEVVSNIHNICHIADDVERFGSLNDISTYPFENFLHEIKLRVQPSSNPMEQITRRIVEQSLNRQNNPKISFNKNRNVFWVEFKYETKQIENCSCFKYIKIAPNVILSSKTIGDKWFLTKSGKIVAMEYATIKNHQYLIKGKAIKKSTIFS